MAQQQHQGGGWGWHVVAVLVIAGGAGLLGAMKVALFVFPVPHLTFLHYLATIILGWGSSVVWGTKQPLAHPLGLRIVSYVVLMLELVLVGGLYEAARHGASSFEKLFSFGGSGGKTVDRESDDPAKWLPYHYKTFKAYLPSYLVKRDEIRPSMERTPVQDRRLDDYGFVVGYANNRPDDPLAVSAELSMLVMGEPRSGKTGRLVIPWVSSWQGPLVTTSTKTEVLRTTLLARKQVSEHVYVLGVPGTSIPEEVEPISYDICWFYENDWGALTDAAERRAKIFAEVAEDTSTQIWESATKQLFTCLLLIGFAWRCAQIEYQGQAHLSGLPNLLEINPMTNHIDVLQIVSSLDWAKSEKGVEEVCAFLSKETPGGQGPNVAKFVRNVARTFRGNASTTEFAQTITGIIAVGLGKLNDPQIAAVFSTPWDQPVFDLERFLDESGTLYLISRDSDSKELAKFFSLVVNEIYAAAKLRAQTMTRCDPPLAFVLDEVANIAPLPNLKSYMSEGGGQGIATVAVVQSFTQLKTTYGEAKADEIFSSANVILAFGGEKDPDALRRLCSLAGDTKVPMGTYDSKQKLTGRTDTIQAALVPDKLSNMKKGWMLVKVPNAGVAMAKAPYWSNKPGSKSGKEDDQSGRKWKREWGGPLDAEVSGYSYHDTKRALSYHATYDLGMQSLKLPLKTLAVEVPVEVPNKVEAGTVSAGADKGADKGAAGGNADTEQFEKIDITDGDIGADGPKEKAPRPTAGKVGGMSGPLVGKRSKILEGGYGIERLFNSIEREETENPNG